VCDKCACEHAFLENVIAYARLRLRHGAKCQRNKDRDTTHGHIQKLGIYQGECVHTRLTRQGPVWMTITLEIVFQSQGLF